MKSLFNQKLVLFSLVLLLLCIFPSELSAKPVRTLPAPDAGEHYVPTAENLKARQEFSGFRLGIFIHWGIYSTFAQGEWYLNDGKLNKDEYAKAATCFYPIRFDARAWARAIRQSGARYITITSRHHDGFSMFDSKVTDYNIVKATPFHRDVLKELSEACAENGLKLHFYYSLLDWIREDYPVGRTGHFTGRKGDKQDYNHYFEFMKAQLRELLTNYGPIGAIWFDGYWDHDDDKPAFDWRMPELYRLIHSLQPACLVGNNHHIAPLEGEDFQMFERDLPGENKAGLSGGATVSTLPLEMCQTMNGMWGYKVADLNYKTTDQLIQLLVQAASKGSNLLINIGPRPNGELPEQALDRLDGLGRWTSVYGPAIYETSAGCMAEQPWGVSTQKGNNLFIHVLKAGTRAISFPLGRRVKSAATFVGQQPLKFRQDRNGQVTINLPEETAGPDYVVQLTLKDLGNKARK